MNLWKFLIMLKLWNSHQRFLGVKTASTNYTKLIAYSKLTLYRKPEANSVPYQTSKLNFFLRK